MTIHEEVKTLFLDIVDQNSIDRMHSKSWYCWLLIASLAQKKRSKFIKFQLYNLKWRRNFRFCLLRSHFLFFIFYFIFFIIFKDHKQFCVLILLYLYIWFHFRFRKSTSCNYTSYFFFLILGRQKKLICSNYTKLEIKFNLCNNNNKFKKTQNTYACYGISIKKTHI